VIIARHRMIMNVLLFALFAVAVVIPPALADKREDAYAGVEHWSQAFNSGDVEQIVRMYTNDALVLGTLSPAMTSKPDDLRAYFKADRKITGEARRPFCCCPCRRCCWTGRPAALSC
jgi:hypothetical protein